MQRNYNFYALIYLLMWGIIIGICSYLAPYLANDYRYMLVEGTDNIVTSASDIFISQYRHYFDWGGRSIAHLIAQFLLYWGKPYNAIITAFCYCALVLGIYYNALGIKPSFKNLRLAPLVFITVLLWLCMSNFGEVTFNIVSSCNYLYTAVIILYFLLPYRLSFQKEALKGSFLFALFMFVLGVIAGWTNENNSAAACFGTFLICAYLFYHKKLTFWQISGFVGLCLGFLILMLAPGNEARLEVMEARGFNYFEHLGSAIKIFGESLLSQALLLVILGFAIYKIRSLCLQMANSFQYLASWWLFSIGFVSLAVMIASPNFPGRAAAPFSMFALSGILGFLNILYERNYPLIPVFFKHIIGVIAVVFVFSTVVNTVICYTQIHNDELYRQNEIALQLNNGSKNLVVSPLQVMPSKYIYLADVQKKPDYWTNLILKRYYKVDSIVRSCDIDKSSIPRDFLFFAKIGILCKK